MHYNLFNFNAPTTVHLLLESTLHGNVTTNTLTLPDVLSIRIVIHGTQQIAFINTTNADSPVFTVETYTGTIEVDESLPQVKVTACQEDQAKFSELSRATGISDSTLHTDLVDLAEKQHYTWLENGVKRGATLSNKEWELYVAQQISTRNEIKLLTRNLI
jgi:hypothetical protein